MKSYIVITTRARVKFELPSVPKFRPQKYIISYLMPVSFKKENNLSDTGIEREIRSYCGRNFRTGGNSNFTLHQYLHLFSLQGRHVLTLFFA